MGNSTGAKCSFCCKYGKGSGCLQGSYHCDNPVICMDETPVQLIGETKLPIEMKPGQEKKEDYEYHRNGGANFFMANEPLTGKRYLKVTKTKTNQDWASFIKEIVDSNYCQATKIALVMDNYGTHTTGAFYETFDAEEAKRLMDKTDFIFTPKHGSWLNMAEIEFNVLQNQCFKSVHCNYRNTTVRSNSMDQRSKQ